MRAAADDVEGFQREARRVDLGVARGAGGVGAVLVELLADGLGAAHVRLDRRDVRRRRLGRLAQQAVHHERAARHRRGRGAVGGDLQDRRLRQERRRAGEPAGSATRRICEPLTPGMP